MKRKLILYFSIGLLSCGLIVTLFAYDKNSLASKISLIGLLLGTGGSILSLFMPTYYERIFKKDEWKTDDKGLYIMIPKRKHGFDKPTITISIQTDGVYQAIYAPRQVNDKGDVIVRVNNPVDCKIKIS
ncbi:hypothetical protein [Chryseobacterium lactis]|nr:hypothetical protein [Chryseobacterium lactis]